MSGSWNSMLWLWNRETGTFVGELQRGGTCWVSSLTISNDGERSVCGS